MDALVFLLMNSVVALSSFILAYRLFRLSGFVDSLICCFTLYFAQIAATELILGVLGALYIKNLIILNTAILLVVWAAARRKAPSFKLMPLEIVISRLFSNRVILLGVCVILCFGLVKVFINLANPPFGWDSLNYHFTFPVEWLKHGNLQNPITISDDPAPTYYPIGGSLFFLWLILPFKSVFLADLGQVPFFILAFLAAYGVSRKLGLNEEPSFLAAAMFLIIPNFFKQLQIAYVDVMVAALFLSCLNALFLLRKDFSFKNILIWSISMGLFLSTKTVALPYAALLALPFMFLAFKNPRRFYLFIISGLIIIALGGYSYIRNFIETGNPFYPLHISLFGMTFFRGVIDTSAYRAHLKPEDYRLAKLLFHEGLGLQTLLFILPSVFLALPVAAIKRRKGLDFNLAYMMVLPLLLYLVYRYIIPLQNVRYLYPLLGMGTILGFYVAGALNIPKKLISTFALICIISSMAELAKRRELVTSIILTALIFPASFFLVRFKPRIVIKKSLFIPAFVILAFALTLAEEDYAKNEYIRYIKMVKYSGFWPDAARAWYWLNENTRGDNIAYAGRPVPFPLYGENFKNNVYYASVNKTDPAKLHYFRNSRYVWDYDFLSLHRNLEAEGNYRSGADYSAWLNNFTRRKTDYLFIYSLHQTKDIMFPVEDAWAKANASRFSPVFTNQTVHIYKVIR